MQLPIMVTHGLYSVNPGCSLNGELSGIIEACGSVANCQSVIDMALRQVHFLLSGVLGNVAMGLPHRDVQLGTKSQEQFFPHDAHEDSVSRGVTLALLEVLCGDDALVELLVAILAESDQIIRGISSGLPALPVMHMELDIVLLGGVGVTALTGVAIPPEDVLPDTVLPEHFALLVVLALWNRLAFLHCLDKLEVKLSSLNDHFCHGEQIANPLNCRDVFLNLDLHRGCEPSLVLAVYPVVEPRLTIPGFAVSPCSAELPAGREIVHYIVARVDLFGEQFLSLGAAGNSDGLAPRIHADNDFLRVMRGRHDHLNGEWGSVLYFGSLGIQKVPSLRFGAGHQGTPIFCDNID